MNQNRTRRLLICLIMDLLGYASYTLPGLGELTDLIWAPVSALVFYRMFGSWKGVVGGIFNFVEEILPGTDFIPSFTLMWLLQEFGSQVPGKEKIAAVSHPG